MLQIDDTIISLDLFDEKFVCDLASCKGECCIEGDAGAPLEHNEIKIIENLIDQVTGEVWNMNGDDIKELKEVQELIY